MTIGGRVLLAVGCLFLLVGGIAVALRFTGGFDSWMDMSGEMCGRGQLDPDVPCTPGDEAQVRAALTYAPLGVAVAGAALAALGVMLARRGKILARLTTEGVLARVTVVHAQQRSIQESGRQGYALTLRFDDGEEIEVRAFSRRRLSAGDAIDVRHMPADRRTLDVLDGSRTG